MRPNWRKCFSKEFFGMAHSSEKTGLQIPTSEIPNKTFLAVTGLKMTCLGGNFYAVVKGFLSRKAIFLSHANFSDQL